MKLYFRLAAGGIRRNSRLYVPYIMTCSLMVMMYYITDALSGDEMLSAMAGGYIMHELIVIGKVVMALFAAIFLFYTNSFLIKSRMRDFGLYNILGMGKNGIARVMTWETLMVYVISMVFGLGACILFSKLAELLAVKIVQGDAAYQFSVSGPAAAASLIVFAVIFLLIFLNVLRQVFFSKPVELLRSENSGEKPPKANWFAAVLGALMLGLAYFMAVTIEESRSAPSSHSWRLFSSLSPRPTCCSSLARWCCAGCSRRIRGTTTRPTTSSPCRRCPTACGRTAPGLLRYAFSARWCW